MSNDLFADAYVVTILDADTSYQSDPVDNTGYGTEAGEPAPPSPFSRTAWWRYTPREDGTAGFFTENSPTFTDTYIEVFTGASLDALTLIGGDDDSGWDEETSNLYLPGLTAGTTYHIRVSSEATTGLRLTVHGPTTSLDPTVPPMDASARMLADPPMALLDDAPPMRAELSADPGVQPPPVHTAPPMAAVAAMPAPDVLRVRRWLSVPADNATVPVDRPVFTVTVAVIEGDQDAATVEVQYAADAAFTAPTTLSTTVRLVHGDNTIRLTPADPLTGAVYWRARLVLNGQTMSWTPARSLLIDLSAGDGTALASWTVAATATDGHLWYVDPPAGRPGDIIRIIGQGLSDDGDVHLGDQTMSVISRTQVPTGSGERIIDPDNDIVWPEHDEILVQVPDDAPAPGGKLWVED